MTADFIEVYEDALSAAQCVALIDAFEASGQAVDGQVGGGVYPQLKRSSDITISGKPTWRDSEVALNLAMLAGLTAYLRRYPYTLIAPLMLQVPGADGQLRRLQADDIASMSDVELGALARQVFMPGDINLQRYRADQGGYPYWHCELFPRHADAQTLHRHLLWTIYLNDDFAEGETEFLHQGRKVVPRRGSLLIAPAAFTHTHRGNRPRGGDKYIATSWILFKRAEQLYTS
jgi:2OG-Fe(II) oxygenase superfamily